MGEQIEPWYRVQTEQSDDPVEARRREPRMERADG